MFIYGYNFSYNALSVTLVLYMDKFIFLLLTLLFVAPLAVVYLIRNDLRKMIIKSSIAGGLAGLISEYWYFQDYWRPPSLLGQSRISVEDFLFGFGVTGLAVVGYKFLAKRQLESGKYPKHHALFGGMFLVGIISMLVFNGALHINSILVSSLAFLAFSALILILRKDLLISCVMSGLLVAGFAFLAYLFLFGLLSPHYWDRYWLLAGTKFGIKLFGSVPLTELLWYFSWGSLAGISYEFVSGKGFRKS